MNNVTLPMVLWNLLGECVAELPFFLDGGIYGDELLGVSGVFSSTPSCTKGGSEYGNVSLIQLV